VLSIRRPGPRPFAEGRFFRELMWAGRQVGIRLIIFSPLDIDWERGRVLGFVYVPSRGWRSRYYPVPRLIYDRLFPSSGTWGLYYNQVIRMRRVFRVRMLNRGLRGKWQMYRIVRRYEDLRPYLPETRLGSYRNLSVMLAKYSTVFVKPVFGSGGKGICRIQRGRDGYLVDRSGRPRIRTHSLLGVIYALGGINRRYLIQQGLKLNYLNGRTFDVRSIVQRNGQGEWQVSGKAIRAGRRGRITSNLHTGGRAYNVSSVLQQYFPDRAEEIEKEMEALAVRVAEVMSQRAGPLCDLGLDMGVDVNGKVWLIEVNSKPGRTVFLRMGDREGRRRVVQTLMEYARYQIDQQRQRR
jgi:glutathione synthase/RimK-type ligase-like ATP-grasp enzyme